MCDTLFISASFFGYASEIKSAIELRGHSVLWFEDRPSLDTKTKALLRLAPFLVRSKSEAYFEDIIEQARKHPIRDVLVIKGEALSPNMIRKMRAALPDARFTLYFWDSYRNMPSDSSQKVDLFDKAFSFDPIDVANDSRLAFRPLFYLDDYVRIQNNKSYDIDVLFIGTAHSDRYAVLKRITKAIPSDQKIVQVLFMRSHLIYYLQRIFNPAYWFARKNEFVFKPLNKSAVMALIARARVVIDIERAVQNGYTMRTIEMLGAFRKLITTNKNIEFADFYSINNHLVVDRDKPIIPNEFINSEWSPIEQDLLNKYSLSGWVDEVLYSNQGNSV